MNYALFKVKMSNNRSEEHNIIAHEFDEVSGFVKVRDLQGVVHLYQPQHILKYSLEDVYIPDNNEDLNG